MNKKKVIQMGGSVRSGTTITGLVLANRPNAVMLGEVMHLFKPYHELHYKKIQELQDDEKWSKILSDGATRLYENVFLLYPNIELIIDSSKDPFWFKYLVSKNRNLQISQFLTFKSPDGLRQSFKKRGLENYETVYINYYKRFFTLFPESETINTERFLEDLSIAEKLQSYLDLELQPKAIEYWQKNHPNFFGSQTVKKRSIEIEKSKTKSISYAENTIRMYDLLVSKEFQSNELQSIPYEMTYNNFSMFLFKLKSFYFKKYLYSL